MKIKRQPEEFRVEEMDTVSLAQQGRCTLYRLTKRGLGTIEAIEAIRSRWNLARGRVSYGGLKDRYVRRGDRLVRKVTSPQARTKHSIPRSGRKSFTRRDLQAWQAAHS
jgi:hypothetical protein